MRWYYVWFKGRSFFNDVAFLTRDAVYSVVVFVGLSVHLSVTRTLLVLYTLAARQCPRSHNVFGLSVPLVPSFVRSDLWSPYLMNGLSNFDETDRQCSVAHTSREVLYVLDHSGGSSTIPSSIAQRGVVLDHSGGSSILSSSRSHDVIDDFRVRPDSNPRLAL